MKVNPRPKFIKKKKTTKKAFSKKSAVVNRSLVKAGLGFPKKMLMTHKYVANIQLNGTAGAMGTYLFSCNGLYDPDYTGTGHQPLGFDQLSAVYNHYYCIGSKIKVTLLPNNVSTNATAYGILLNDDTTVSPSNYVLMAEQTPSKVKFISLANSTPRVITAKWSAKKTFGGSILGNSDLKGTSAANPSEQTYYTIYCQAVDLAATVNFQAQIELEYITIWTELKELAQS